MERVFNYCERGLDPSFWAEPLNAVTNAAFLIAAIAGGLLILARAPGERRVADYVLVLLAAAIAVGSFLFHTLATRWAGAADVIPILLFMLLAVFLVLRRLIGLSGLLAAAGVLGFIALIAGSFRLCSVGLCFNGSIGYGPALLMLAVCGAILIGRGRRAEGTALLSAGAVFFLSLTARTVDRDLCDWTMQYGTHFLWHTFNGVTLYLVMRALIGAHARLRPA